MNRLETEASIKRIEFARELAKVIDLEDVQYIAYELVAKDISTALGLKRELELWLENKGIKDEPN